VNRIFVRVLLVGAVVLACAAPRAILAQRGESAPVEAGSPIAGALNKANAALETILEIPDAQRNFANTLGALDGVIVQLQIDTNMTQFMKFVSHDKDERDRGAQAEEDYNNWMIALGKNERLYNAVKTVAQVNETLDFEQARVLKFALRDFRRAGMELSAGVRDELKKLQMEISKLGIQFDTNISEDESIVPLTRQELAGVPEDYFANPNLKKTGELYLVNMSYPQFNPIMDFCDNETTRQKVWVAYKRRGGKKNVQILETILKKRAEAAALLGYRNPAEFEAEIRMAKSASNVQAFYEKLRPLVREKARADFDEFTQAKRQHTNDPAAKLRPWDFQYYLEVLRKTRYAVDGEKVREYFPMERVVDGLFSITQSLYGLEYRDITEDVRANPAKSPAGHALWDPDVKVYEVWDKNQNKQLGAFYVDLYPRENKYTHAAAWPLVPRKVWPDGRITLPVTALVCNFTRSTPTKPSLLPHEEVETFFHEFGHCLHNILTEARYGQFSGTSVETDFVEAPSQMFENWVWDAAVLNTFARHYKTGEPLPGDLLQGMINARYLGSGLFAEHQFYYALVDMTYHTAPEGRVDTTKISEELFPQIELYEPVPQVYFQASFGHLVGYQAGYYSYQWSLVYAQDMFQRFKELGLLNPDAGMYYRKKILARGGTMDAMDMIKDYLGREPQMDAYLEHLGLKRSLEGSSKRAGASEPQ
jgi:thimet oligopeptidase